MPKPATASKSKVSVGRQRALGIEGTPPAVYLVGAFPSLFDGVATPEQYQEKTNELVGECERAISGGKFLSTSFDSDGFARIHGWRPDEDEGKQRLDDIRGRQQNTQSGWVSYLRENGYSIEHRFLILTSITREVAVRTGEKWRIRELGGSSSRMPPSADPELAAMFVERFTGEVRPSRALAEFGQEIATKRNARVGKEEEAGTDQANEITWVKFPWTREGRPGYSKEKFDKTVAELEALAKTVEVFGMCSWCTAHGMAPSQIKGGDFWVGVDNQGRARVSLRMEGEQRIGEISGILPGQSMEPAFAVAVSELVSKNNFSGGERFVSDALLKGRVAEMRKPGDWEEFKEIIGRATDEEAIEHVATYRGPKGSNDYLVGADNGAMQKTIFEKCRGGRWAGLPLIQTAERGQLSCCRDWLTGEMLDEKTEDGEPVLHKMLAASDVRGGDVVSKLLEWGMFTHDRQLSLGKDDRTALGLSASRGGLARAKIQNPEVALSPDALSATDKNDNNAWHYLAEGATEASINGVIRLAKSGLFRLEDQTRLDRQNRSPLLIAARNAGPGDGGGCCLSRLVNAGAVDNAVALTAPCGGYGCPVGAMGLNEEGDLQAINILRASGVINKQNIATLQGQGDLFLHRSARSRAMGLMMSWPEMPTSVFMTPDPYGNTALGTFLSSRGAMEEKLAACDGRLSRDLLCSGGDGKKPPVINIAEGGGLAVLIRDGVLTREEITAVRHGEKLKSPWHSLFLGSDAAEQISDGFITPADMMVRDADDNTAAMDIVSSKISGPALFRSSLVTGGVMDAKNSSGQTISHLAMSEGMIASLLDLHDPNRRTPMREIGRDGIAGAADSVLTHERLTEKDAQGRTPWHMFKGVPNYPAMNFTSLKQLKESGLVRAEDFGEPDNNLDTPAHIFARTKSFPWLTELVNEGLLSSETLNEENSDGKTPLDYFRGTEQWEVKLAESLAENGLITKEMLQRKSGGKTLLTRMLSAGGTPWHAQETLTHLEKHLGVTPDDLEEADMLVLLPEESRAGSDEGTLSNLVEKGWISRKALSCPSVWKRVFAIATPEDLNSLAPRGFLTKGLMSETRINSYPSAVACLLDEDGAPDKSTKFLVECVKAGVVTKESLMPDTGDGDSRGLSYYMQMRSAPKLLFKARNSEVLEAMVSHGVLGTLRPPKEPDASIAAEAVGVGGRRLDMLIDNGCLPPGCLKGLVVEGSLLKCDALSYLTSEHPENFKHMIEAGIVSSDEVLHHPKRADLFRDGVRNGAIVHFPPLDVRDYRIRKQITGEVLKYTRNAEEVGNGVDYLFSCGVSVSDIRKEVVGWDSECRPLGAVMAETEGSILLGLQKKGGIGRRDILLVRGEETGLSEIGQALLENNPERWEEMRRSGLLQPGDLCRYHGTMGRTPLRNVVDGYRARGVKDGERLAEIIRASGLLVDGDGPKAACSLANNPKVGWVALKALLRSGVLKPEDFCSKVSGDSAINKLGRLARKHGTDVLDVLSKMDDFPDTQRGKLERALDGNPSKIADALDAVGNMLGGMFFPKAGSSASRAREKESASLARGKNTKEEAAADSVRRGGVA